MEKNFLDFSYQIELNEKNLENYQELYEKTLSKISFISIIYSILALYTAQIIQFAIDNNFKTLKFSISLIIYIALVIISIIYTIKFLIPIKISHLHCPKYYYRDIKKNYEDQGLGKTQESMNKYLQSTYLNELEKAVDNNFDAFKKKRKLFYYAFITVLMSLLPYLFCLGFYFEKPKTEIPKKVEIVNFNSLHSKKDSACKK